MYRTTTARRDWDSSSGDYDVGQLLEDLANKPRVVQTSTTDGFLAANYQGVAIVPPAAHDTAPPERKVILDLPTGPMGCRARGPIVEPTETMTVPRDRQRRRGAWRTIAIVLVLMIALAVTAVATAPLFSSR
jgi:hypothetical protein